jgi:predicted amidohydrolase
MQLILVQWNVAWETPSENFRAVNRLLDGTIVEPRALIVLPEMFSVGFTMNVAALAEDEGGATEKYLGELAARRGAFVLGGVMRRGTGGRGRNEAVVFDPDGNLLVRYAKLHPFSYAGETDHFEPGNEILVFDWDGLRAAPFVCYDLRFPEIYRHAVTLGAQMFVTIANFPSARVHHWTSLLVARAVENQAYSVGVNRCGSDPNGRYPGRSIVIDPRGRILVEAGAAEDVITVEIDPLSVVRYRDMFPALRDMRPDLLHAELPHSGS